LFAIVTCSWPYPWGDAFADRVMDQPVYVYYDWSNCPISSNDIGKVVKLATQGRAPINRRIVFCFLGIGSCCSDAEKQKLDRHWNLYHEFETYLLVQHGNREVSPANKKPCRFSLLFWTPICCLQTFIDDFLHAHITTDVASEVMARAMRVSFGEY
jgi:hypothetical protein